MKNYEYDTIVAPATSEGKGSISIIRLSGPLSIEIANKIFDKNLTIQKGNTLHFGKIYENKEFIDEVVISIFKAPKSYTKEDIIEISCHASSYIIRKIINLIIKHGARYAHRGEFTKRAFLNGRYDLTQAEAVADIIQSNSKLSHKIAFSNMKGEFSSKLKEIRNELINFISLLELELDFSEEDIEFVDRDKLYKFLKNIIRLFKPLIDGFRYSNVIKDGIPLAIVGKPNVGKSTLLNNLVGDERSIISDIPGTTRDYIEDTLTIKDITYRVIDTAGLRETNDEIEQIGIKKTYEKIQKAYLVLYIIDTSEDNIDTINKNIHSLKKLNNNILVVCNKIDLANLTKLDLLKNLKDKYVKISAKDDVGIEDLKKNILKLTKISNYDSEILSINGRHYDCLIKCKTVLDKILESLSLNITTELIISEIKEALQYIGEITGEITTDDLLENIFSKFCIGK